jgi:hypothetical protein
MQDQPEELRAAFWAASADRGAFVVGKSIARYSNPSLGLESRASDQIQRSWTGLGVGCFCRKADIKWLAQPIDMVESDPKRSIDRMHHFFELGRLTTGGG